MNNDVVVHAVQDAPMPRRDFLRKSILLALPAAFGGFVAPAAAAISMSSPLPAAVGAQRTFTPPSRARGSTEINVLNRGAHGDGSHDDTAAFQNAIDALPSDGGTVFVPAGIYLIDATVMVRLRSRMHLRMASGAVLAAKRNAADRYHVLEMHKVNDVEISGGEIEGDRDRHTGTTGQWGHGIMVRGSSRVTIRDILIRKCWGDGITVAASIPERNNPQVVGSDIVIANVACLDNRRAGMSLGQARRVRIYDSEFSYTGGITPGCGLNIESDYPNPGASDTHIENCVFRHNQANGIQVYRRSVGTTIRRCTIEKNNGYGILTIGAKDVWIALNQIRSNQLIGVGMRSQSNNVSLAENRFYNNGRQFRTWDLQMLTPPSARAGQVHDRHTEVANSQSIAINTNLYYDKVD